MYDHGDVKEDWTLKSLATDLLRLLFSENRDWRPLFFVCHSIGGLIVKLALTEAYRNSEYRPFVEYCHGITFFATPQHGSIYLSTDDFTSSIQQLLDLRAPLPVSLTRQLSVDDYALRKIDENFKRLVGEFQLWTFYESVDSLLHSNKNTTLSNGIQYTAPITPMRSAILGVRQEKIYALRSTHAECAWFEGEDYPTMELYLRNLCDSISKAATFYKNYGFIHQALSSKKLEPKVSVEVHGFYEHRTPAKKDPIVRLLSIKQSLQRFLSWGPDAMLNERLINTRPLGLDYGPMVGLGLKVGRTFI